MLSRSSLKIESNGPEMLEMVHSISKHLPMSEEKKIRFRKATSNDEVLAKIFEYYFNEWPSENKL